jgi:hypothetical protein
MKQEWKWMPLCQKGLSTAKAVLPLVMMLWAVLAPGVAAAGDGTLVFQETMDGIAQVNGRPVPVVMSFEATIPDIDSWEEDANHPALLTGTLLFEGHMVPVRGVLHMMAKAKNPELQEEGYYLRYHFETPPGVTPQYRFAGAKHVLDDDGFDVAEDVTTLRGNFVPPGKALNGTEEAKHSQVEVHFRWQDPVVVWNFLDSFETPDAGWFSSLVIKAQFIGIWLNGVIDEYLF